MSSARYSYSALTKAKTKELHKSIREKYEHFSETQVNEIYEEAKTKYEQLKQYLDLDRAQKERKKQKLTELKEARKRCILENDYAKREMNTLQIIGSIFVKKKLTKGQEITRANYLKLLEATDIDDPAAMLKICQRSRRVLNHLFTDEVVPVTQTSYSAHPKSKLVQSQRLQEFKTAHKGQIDYSEHIERRKFLYHELKVLSGIRKEIKQERVKSLAQAYINKQRSTSSSLKRKEQSRFSEEVECPYCQAVFCKSEAVLDHVYPVAKGGQDTKRNTVLVCFKSEVS